MDSLFKGRLRSWIKDLGRAEAGRRLVASGVNIDTAIRLLNGTYTSEPKAELRNQILTAMKGWQK